jgi:hypothetical protein
MSCFRPDARSVVAVNRYPVIIDAIIQSNGAGFVGMCGSTMSMMERLGLSDGGCRELMTTEVI